jgi:protein required for attachment to host cells
MEVALAARAPVRKEPFTMNTTWILTAHRSGASLFESQGKGKPIQRVQDIPRPKGRLQNKDINADKPGRAFDSHGYGRHDMTTEHEPTEEVAMQFARILAELLNKGRTLHAYEKLVLVAEPKFLGLLRAALDSHTAALVVKSVHKDLPDVSEKDLASYLE